MPVPLRMEVKAREIQVPLPPIPEPEPDRLHEVLEALRSLPAPSVVVGPPDLSAIVTAVTSLKPGPTAAEIAAAIADVLRPSPVGEDSTPALREVAEALRTLDFRMKGIGRQAYGGGAASINNWSEMPTTDVSALAKDATLLRRYGDHVTKAGLASDVGDNTLHTPASGKRVRLYWIALSTSQDNAAENLIQVKLTDADGAVKYRWRMGNPGAFSGSRTIDGNVDESLILNLANTQAVDWNIDLEEV